MFFMKQKKLFQILQKEFVMKRANKTILHCEEGNKKLSEKKSQICHEINEKENVMKFPIGLQTFSEIREGKYVYVDKTKEAYELINAYKYVFLSRPQNFGKSVFLDTLQNIIEGKKEHFKGLYIEDKHDFSDVYPVIKISFGGSLIDEKAVLEALNVALRTNKRKHGLWGPQGFNIPNSFKTLLEMSYEEYKKPAVILIDNYDKPVIESMKNGNANFASKAVKILKDFYSVIKDSDQLVKFAFITGASQFAKKVILSSLNNLKDITLDPKFGNICGYTENDIKQFLDDGVDSKELNEWYGGYSFLNDKIYNPIDILNFCDSENVYENYWFNSETTSFLIEQMKKESYCLPDLENIVLSKEMIEGIDTTNPKVETLLFQAGYLSISEAYKNVRNELRYRLVMPNKEVRMGLNSAMLKMLTNNFKKLIVNQDQAFDALHDGKVKDFEKHLKAMFVLVSDTKQSHDELYTNVFYAYVASFGLPLDIAKITNKKDLVMSMLINENRYVFGFSVGSENTLKELKTMKYDKYADEKSKTFLVGVNFDEKEELHIEWEAM